MAKSIVIFGAGPGLGIEVARKYGQQGYQVALVARNQDRLQGLVSQLTQEDIAAEAFAGDLSRIAEIPTLVQAIRNRFGLIDALYFGPEPGPGFVAAAELKVEVAREKLELLFLSFVAILNEVLPELRARKAGPVLAAFGGSAATGIPFLSGPGPALAATRNLIHALHGELAGEGIYAGMLTITATIERSAYHQGVVSGAIKPDLPPGFVVPDVDPAELAELLWQAAETRSTPEVFYPPRG